MSIPSISKEYRVPKPIELRTGCPCEKIPSYRVCSSTEKRTIQSVHDFTTMHLAHQKKTGEIKNRLPLGPIHHELELDSLILQGSGASNILLTKLSFDCCIVDSAGREQRDYISFDLKIPEVNTEQESVFCFDFIESLYGTNANLHSTLQHFYNLGRSRVNPTDHTHGHKPDYDPIATTHAQYIRHTEQLLVAYLALPQGAEMLRNRLQAELRGKYPDTASVKIYNMGLHMHSTKTCCGPCEYTLIGLMNDHSGFIQNEKRIGFLPNFTQVCSIPREQVTFTLPRKSPFRVLVTVTASELDADHRKRMTYTVTKLSAREIPNPTFILVKRPNVSNYIFTTIVESKYTHAQLSASSAVSERTVGISGSKATPGTSGTMRKVVAARSTETNRLAEMLSGLTI